MIRSPRPSYARSHCTRTVRAYRMIAPVLNGAAELLLTPCAIAELAFIERVASLDAGASLAEGKQRGFCLKVPHNQRELTVETISATTSSGSSGVIVSYASGGEAAKARQAATTDDSDFKFDFGKGVGLGAFLASVVGSDISVVRPDGAPLEGLLLNVSDERRAVKGSEHETEAVWSELHVLTEAGGVESIRIDETQAVSLATRRRQLRTPQLRPANHAQRPPAPRNHHAFAPRRRPLECWTPSYTRSWSRASARLSRRGASSRLRRVRTRFG